MDALQQAFKEWQSFSPHHMSMPPQLISYEQDGELRQFIEPKRMDGVCCLHNHYMTYGGKSVPRPDSQVCDRERAWRKYCRLRDGIKEQE